MRISLTLLFLTGLLWFATSVAYDSMIPGIPDAGPYSVPEAPVGLWIYSSGERLVGNSIDGTLVWILSVMTFVLPAAIGGFRMIDPKQRLSVGVAMGLVCTIGGLMLSFTPTLMPSVVGAGRPLASVIALVFSGLVLGYLCGLAFRPNQEA